MVGITWSKVIILVARLWFWWIIMAMDRLTSWKWQSLFGWVSIQDSPKKKYAQNHGHDMSSLLPGFSHEVQTRNRFFSAQKSPCFRFPLPSFSIRGFSPATLEISEVEFLFEKNITNHPTGTVHHKYFKITIWLSNDHSSHSSHSNHSSHSSHHLKHHYNHHENHHRPGVQGQGAKAGELARPSQRCWGWGGCWSSFKGKGNRWGKIWTK